MIQNRYVHYKAKVSRWVYYRPPNHYLTTWKVIIFIKPDLASPMRKILVKI